jgi:acyl carrier protein
VSEQSPLTFDAFQKHLAHLTHLDPERLGMDTNLVLDLGLDSLKLLEIVLEFEELGVPASIADSWGIQTVGDAWDYYQRLVKYPDNE